MMADNRTMEEMLQAPTEGITSTLKFKDVANDAIKLMLFPYSLEGAAKIWYKKEPPRSILTWGDLDPQDELTIIENKLKVHYSRNKSVASKVSKTSSGSSSSMVARIDKVTDTISNLVDTFNKKMHTPAMVKAVEETCVICGGAHPCYDCIAIDSNISVLAWLLITNFKAEMKNEIHSLMLNQIKNVKNELRSDINELRNMMDSYFQKDTASTSGSGSLPSNTIANPRFGNHQINKPNIVVAPKPKLSIPYSSRVTKQKLCEKDDNLALKFVEIFRKQHFDLSFADAFLHMPKFALMFKILHNNKEKLFDLATTSVNENCSAVILKKFPEILGDHGKFLIPSDFLELDECLALADLGASINVMPLSIWRKLSLTKLIPTQMILELADRSTTRLAGIAEDVFVKVGKFHLLTDFVVVDYVVDPRAPLILERPFLRTRQYLIDVYGEELTLRIDDEAITFKVGQTSKYSYNDAESINQIDVIDIAYEEYVQEGGDFILEEIEACLTSKSIPPGIDDIDFDLEGDIRLLEELLNNDTSSSPLPLKELNVEEIKIVKSSIDEPPKIKLKELLSHLEYAFLEGTDKLPVIISKELKDEEKSALLKVLKSHKRAITWKISYIKGIDHLFCTHKNLMEDDFKPTIQHQRRVNLKIPKVIKKEVIKLLDAGLIYLISDSPWVSPVHYVPKKGGMTVIENEDNELIPTRCMMAIFHDMVEKMLEVFVVNFSIFGDYFSSCLSHLDKMLKRCEDTNLVLNWEKCHFMVKDGIVLGHKIFMFGIEVDRANVDVIAKLSHPTSVKEKETPLIYSKECIELFNTLKKKLTEAPILVAPDVGNKMHKAFPLPGESFHWQYKFPLLVKVVPTARRLEMPLSGVCTAIEVMIKKLPFRIQQYLQHEHYALWEVIEFGDSYKVPTNSDPDDSRTKDGRTVTVTTDDMQKKKNDEKARTTLLLSLPDEHQLRNDLDSMSLDDLYNHLKVYEAKVQKKPNSNS
nr:DNA-directed DNA polymerase [Tanacetum cinerariifolium]